MTPFDDEIRSTFGERTYFTPDEMGGYRLMGQCRPSEDVKQRVLAGPHYALAREWAQGIERPMEETEYHRMLVAEVENWTLSGRMLQTVENCGLQYQGYRALFDSIRDNGFTPLGYVYRQHIGRLRRDYYYGDINLRRTDEGGLDWGDGHHRTAILLALGQHVHYLEVS